MNDITFCNNFECIKKDCRRHQLNTPTDEYLLSISDFSPNAKGDCEFYIDGRNY